MGELTTGYNLDCRTDMSYCGMDELVWAGGGVACACIRMRFSSWAGGLLLGLPTQCRTRPEVHSGMGRGLWLQEEETLTGGGAIISKQQCRTETRACKRVVLGLVLLLETARGLRGGGSQAGTQTNLEGLEPGRDTCMNRDAAVCAYKQ